jgi:hypothetical protein
VRSTFVSLAATAALALSPLAVAVPADAAPQHADRRAKVTMRALPATSEAGRRLTVRGKAPAGSIVVVQRKIGAGSAWKKAARTKATRKGAWSVRIKLTRGGTTALRAKVGRSASKADSLKVYQWLWVADQRPVFMLTENNRAAVTATLQNKRSYPRSFTFPMGEDGGVAINTAALCTKASVSSGFTSASKPTADAKAFFQAGDIDKDDAVVSRTVVTGHVATASFSLVGTKTAAFVAYMEAGTFAAGGRGLAIASPRVYCNASKLPALDPSALY